MELINSVIIAIGDSLSFIIGLFPDSIMQNKSLIPVLDNKLVQMLNIFFPVYEILYFIEAFLLCVLGYYAVILIGRFVKLIH